MSKQYPGGVLSATATVPNSGSAPGIWTLDQVMQAQRAGNWPGSAKDPQFNYVTMLLHGDGTNGAQNNTFLDSSSNAYSITRNGTPTQGTWSPYGANWSNYFSGSSYFYFGGQTQFAFGSGDFTIEAWFNSDTSGLQTIIDFRPSSTQGAYPVIYIRADGIIAYYLNSTDAIVGSSVSFGVWNHVAVSRSGSSTKLFLNGTQVGSTFSDTNSYVVGASRPMIADLGYSPGAGYSLKGYISNLRIVKGTAVYTSNFTPSTAPLTAISGTSLLTCQSNRFVDNSSNAFSITINGTPSIQRFSPFSPTSAYSASVIGGSASFPNTGSTAYYLTTAGGMPSGQGTAFTMECWIYLTDLTNYRTITRDPGGSNFDFGVASNGTIQLYLNGGATLICASSSGVITTNAWYHIAVTRTTGNVYTIYVNGVSVASGTNSTSITANTNIGYNSYSNVYNFMGYIADFRVVNSLVYSTTFAPPSSPLTAISGTSLLLNATNAGILDNAEMNDLQTVGSAQISTSVVKYGTGSMSFPATTDYMTSYAISTGTGTWTVEGWFYFSSLSNARTLLSQGTSDTTSCWLLWTDADGTIRFYSGSNLAISSAGAVTTSAWQHIAVVSNSSALTIYVNGTSVATGSYSGKVFTGLPFQINQGYGGSTSGNVCYIDDLRITKGYARYTANFTPPNAAFPNQ